MTLPTYGQALANIGAPEIPDTDLVIARMGDNGRLLHAVASDLAGDEIDASTDLYLAGGAFAAGTVSAFAGRHQDNLRVVLWLQFDADLNDYTGLSKEYLHGLSQPEIDRLIEAQRIDLEEWFGRINLPIHRLDYTGYGLCAYLYLEPVPGADIAMIRDAHKAFIRAINAHSGIRLVDPQASDSGTRITRIPGSWNHKNPDMPRQVRTLWYEPSRHATLDQIRFALKRAMVAPEPAPRPEQLTLGQSVMDEIERAIAPHWTLGQKHAVALGFCGMLAKAGIPEAQTLAAVERLSAGDDKPWDRQRAVRDTYGRIRSGMEIRGFFGLREYLPPTVLDYIDERLARARQATTGKGVFRFERGPRGQHAYEQASESEQARIDDAITAEFPPAPASAYYGWFGEYRDIMAPTSEAPDVFHLGSSLCLAGAMIGRRIFTSYASDQLYPNLYVALIGASGSSRKDTAMKRATRISQLNATHRYIDPAFAIRRDVSSPEGLVTMLKEERNLLLYITEMTGMLKNTKRQATAGLLDRLIEAWDTPAVMQNNTKNSPVQARDPFLSILAATQPGRLAIEMTEQEVNSGFANRWMYFAGSGKPPIARPERLDKVRAWEHYLDLGMATAAYQEDTAIELSETAYDRWDDWYIRSTREVSDNENLQVLRTRHATLIQKTALIFAISDRSQTIKDQHLAAAIDLIEWMWIVVLQLSKTWGVGIDTRIEERILSALRRRGQLTRRRLQQITANSNWGHREFAGVFRAMQENGTLDIDPEGLVSINPEVA